MAKRRTKTPEAAVPAVARALDLVEFLADHVRPYGINELARELEMPVNSVFRILKCLDARGYVESAGQGGAYQLGTRFFLLGMRLQSRFDLRRRARPHLEKLCRESGETAQIYVLDGDSKRFARLNYAPRMRTAPIVHRAFQQDAFATQDDRIPKDAAGNALPSVVVEGTKRLYRLPLPKGQPSPTPVKP